MLRFMDTAFGLVIYEVIGNFDGGVLELAGDVKQTPPGIETGPIKVRGILTSQGNLRGEWKCSLGTPRQHDQAAHSGRLRPANPLHRSEATPPPPLYL